MGNAYYSQADRKKASVILSQSPSRHGCTAIVLPVIIIRTRSILYYYYNPHTNYYLQNDVFQLDLGATGRPLSRPGIPGLQALLPPERRTTVVDGLSTHPVLPAL